MGDDMSNFISFSHHFSPFDRLVDMEILKHLQKVLADCNLMEGPNAKQSCKAQLAEYEEAADGYQGKCKFNSHIHSHCAKALVSPPHSPL